MPALDRTVAEIPKGARESIRIALREKGGTVGAEMRVTTLNGRGVRTETPKGLRIPLARLGDTIAALQEAERLAVADGLLPGAEPAAADG